MAVLTALPLWMLDRVLQSFWVMHTEQTINHWLATNNPGHYSHTAAEAFWQPFFTLHSLGLYMTTAVHMSIDYMVQSLLDRVLPTRGNSAAPIYLDRQSYEKITDNDPVHEGEIVRKLIAQGKIKRASINWGTVFLKWILYHAVFLPISMWIWHFGNNLTNGEPFKDFFSVFSVVSESKI